MLPFWLLTEADSKPADRILIELFFEFKVSSPLQFPNFIGLFSVCILILPILLFSDYGLFSKVRSIFPVFSFIATGPFSEII